jgi:CheY-like chemotaxis protein
VKQTEKPLVLVVDDQPDNLYMYSQYLESQGRLRIITAMTGPEALVKARRLQPDVILLDLSIPQMNGYEIARALAADESTKHIPIILVSAYASQADAIEALGESSFASFVGEVEVGFVSKPCAPEALLQHVRTAVDARAAARS